MRQRGAHALLHQVQPVAAVAAEALVAAVARQRDRHVLARELADAVGRNRRAVGVRLVVQPRQRVDQVEVVALDRARHDAACGSGRRPLRVRRLVERRVVEGDRAGVDRLGRTGPPSSPPRRSNRRRPTGTRRAALPRSCAAAPIRAAGASSSSARVGWPIGSSGREPHVPVLRAASGSGWPRRSDERVRRRQLAHACVKIAARLGDVAEREVLLDRQRVDVAPQRRRARSSDFSSEPNSRSAVGEQRVVAAA